MMYYASALLINYLESSQKLKKYIFPKNWNYITQKLPTETQRLIERKNKECPSKYHFDFTKLS